MDEPFPIYNFEDPKHFLNGVVIVEQEIMSLIKLARAYLKLPLIRKKLHEDPVGWDLASLTGPLITNPLPLDLVLRFLPSSLRSLLQISEDIASNSVPCQSSIEDEKRFNFSQPHRSKVQDCLALDVKQLVNYGLLSPDVPDRGVLVLINVYSGGGRFIVWAIERSSRQSLLSLYFVGPNEKVFTSRTEIWRSKRSSNLILADWWLRCPHELKGSRRTSRFTKLYLQPGGSILACRRCLNLDLRRSEEMKRRPLSLLPTPNSQTRQ